MRKKKQQMPSYYGKNIAQHAQKKFFQRKALEAEQKKRRNNPAADMENSKER